MTKRGMSVARVMFAIALLVIAAVIWRHIPTKLQSWAPITVEGPVGQRIVEDDLAVTVNRAELARVVTTVDDGVVNELASKGVWLAISLTCESLRIDQKPTLILQAAGRTFESPLTDLRRQAAPGIPRKGVVAFQLPDVPEDAALFVSHAAADQWGNPLLAPLDTQIEVTIPLRGKDIHDALDLSRMNEQ